MYLFVIIAFGLLFWRTDQQIAWPGWTVESPAGTLAIVVGPVALVTVAGWWINRRALRLLHQQPLVPHAAQLFQHRGMFALRIVLLGGFAAALFLTAWPSWFVWHPLLQIVGDLIVLSPFLLGVTLLWTTAYPVDRRMRAISWSPGGAAGGSSGAGLSLRSYVESFLRNQVLVFAVPLTLILLAADLTRGYATTLAAWSGGRAWTGDLVLGAVAVGVFAFAPLLLIRVWHTRPLEAGPLRDRLEAICRRIGLRCRDILVWQSDSTIVNAAVMGLVPRLRYVLLSDGLLKSMDTRQVEAVFGHEAGHVRHHHIPHFLLFAFAGWLLAVGVMELVLQIGGEDVSPTLVQGIGMTITLAVWGVGFGWVSRRFERQADVFGAACVTPDDDCAAPCSVHLTGLAPKAARKRVCATGAAIFASALERVAVLNGIPLEERSWRHSSIGSRIRFLTQLAADPTSAKRFQRTVQWIKHALLAASVLGAAALAAYLLLVPEPALLR